MSGSVVQLCLSHSWGGLEMSTIETAIRFADAGYPSICICPGHSTLSEKARKLGLKVVNVGRGGYVSLKTSRTIRGTVDTNQAKAVFVHQLRDLWLLRPALFGRPDVRVLGFARMFPNVSKIDPWHRYIYQRLDRLIVLSQRQFEHLLTRLPVPQDKYSVIPNGTDTRRFHPQRRSEGVRKQWLKNSAELLLGVIGRIDPQKGQREFLHALALIKKNRPDLEWRAIITGTTTYNESHLNLMDELNEIIRSNSMSDRVIFTGHRDDIPEIMASLDIFVLPSYEETFGRVLIEAMACGTPVIATNAGGVPEILGNGAYGRLIAPRDPHSLAQALTELMESNTLRQSFIRKGIERVKQAYDSQLVFNQIERIMGGG